MRYPVMLATPGNGSDDPLNVIRFLQEQGRWVFEFKYDGVRAVIVISNGKVTIINRRERDITFRYPDIVQQLTGLPDMVLDGEIVCCDTRGRPDFHLIHRRDAQESAARAARLAASIPAQYVVFDVLIRGGEDLRGRPYWFRHEALIRLGLAEHGVVVPPTSTDGAMLWAAVEELGLEGLVAKRKDSTYRSGESPAWVKIKRWRRLSALVGGYTPGEGSRASTFGALCLRLLGDNDTLVDVGDVGSGFSEADIREIWQLLASGGPPIVVEVQYLELSRSGRLRSPVFVGIRSDVDPHACTLDQTKE